MKMKLEIHPPWPLCKFRADVQFDCSCSSILQSELIFYNYQLRQVQYPQVLLKGFLDYSARQQSVPISVLNLYYISLSRQPVYLCLNPKYQNFSDWLETRILLIRLHQQVWYCQLNQSS